MKIRHRQTGAIEEVDGEWLDWYVQWMSGADRLDTYLRTDYEPVPETRWEDVSGEVEVVAPPDDMERCCGIVQHHHDRPNRNTLFVLPALMHLEGYRLRKVRVMFDGPDWTTQGTRGEAFVVERKESL